MRSYFAGTIGVSCASMIFDVANPEYTFLGVKWSPEHHAEDFSFSRCRIVYDGSTYDGLVYYPHPDTKIGHFHDRATLEILAPFIRGIRYGVEVKLDINPDEITVIDG